MDITTTPPTPAPSITLTESPVTVTSPPPGGDNTIPIVVAVVAAVLLLISIIGFTVAVSARIYGRGKKPMMLEAMEGNEAAENEYPSMKEEELSSLSTRNKKKPLSEETYANERSTQDVVEENSGDGFSQQEREYATITPNLSSEHSEPSRMMGGVSETADSATEGTYDEINNQADEADRDIVLVSSNQSYGVNAHRTGTNHEAEQEHVMFHPNGAGQVLEHSSTQDTPVTTEDVNDSVYDVVDPQPCIQYLIASSNQTEYDEIGNQHSCNEDDVMASVNPSYGLHAQQAVSEMEREHTLLSHHGAGLILGQSSIGDGGQDQPNDIAVEMNPSYKRVQGSRGRANVASATQVSIQGTQFSRQDEGVVKTSEIKAKPKHISMSRKQQENHSEDDTKLTHEHHCAEAKETIALVQNSSYTTSPVSWQRTSLENDNEGGEPNIETSVNQSYSSFQKTTNAERDDDYSDNLATVPNQAYCSFRKAGQQEEENDVEEESYIPTIPNRSYISFQPCSEKKSHTTLSSHQRYSILPNKPHEDKVKTDNTSNSFNAAAPEKSLQGDSSGVNTSKPHDTTESNSCEPSYSFPQETPHRIPPPDTMEYISTTSNMAYVSSRSNPYSSKPALKPKPKIMTPRPVLKPKPRVEQHSEMSATSNCYQQHAVQDEGVDSDAITACNVPMVKNIAYGLHKR